jgi:hypothetical protein
MLFLSFLLNSGCRHYQDAYAGLVLMFGSVAMLPPRTKRWAEAKVLADCIDLKVCVHLIVYPQLSMTATRFVNCIFIIMSIRSHYPSIIHTSASSETSPGSGGSAKTHSSFGAG